MNLLFRADAPGGRAADYGAAPFLIMEWEKA
jgi:hypothetical protein